MDLSWHEMTGTKLFLGFWILLSLLHNGYPANILGLMGCTSHSHQLWNDVIVQALVERGHTFTIASVDENTSPKSNVTYIHLEGAYKMIDDYYKDTDANYNTYGPFATLRLLYNFEMLECKAILQSKGFQEASNLNQKFDMILFDITTGPCIFRLIQQYPGIPVVAVSAFKMDPNFLEIVGGHSYPGYITYFLDQQERSMNLWKRLTNSATYVFAYLYRRYITEAVIERYADQYVPHPRPSLKTLFRRVKIALINTHPSIDNALSLPPNIIEVGGLHIGKPRKLSQDIDAFIESATKGVILISLGSNAMVETIGPKRISAFLNTIRSFPDYAFLWKIEREGIVNDIPDNLLIRKWLPQSDILANPKVKAFFTHAGSLSMQESTWYGVPVIMMPLFFDQFANSHNAKLKGCGVEVNFETLNEESLKQAFTKVLNDTSYKSRMLEMQRKFRNRQNRPLDTAVWWIEYFLSDPNAEHLSLISRDVSFFVANSFDVIGIFLVFCAVLLTIAWSVFKQIWKKFLTQSQNLISMVKIFFKRKTKTI